MFRKQVDPKLVSVSVLVVLVGIIYVYWRQLVYREPGHGARPSGMGGAPPGEEAVYGRDDLVVETAAGDAPGYQDGPGWQARFCGPNALALAPDGTLFIADSRNHRIRRLSPDGQVSTFAGSGEPGGEGGVADGPVAAARFRYPSGVALGADGTVYVADAGNHRICRIANGEVTTLAGGTEGKADGQGAAARFRIPAAMVVDAEGALWVADSGNAAIRRVDGSGGVSTPAPPRAVAEALGDLAEPAAARPFYASPTGRLPPAPAPDFLTMGRASPGTAPGLPGGAPMRLFADTRFHVLMGQRPGEPLLLVAGRRVRQSFPGYLDGEGVRAEFALPCAVVLAPGGIAYITEYEGNRIRRARLPEWLWRGLPAPLNVPRNWRQRSGR